MIILILCFVDWLNLITDVSNNGSKQKKQSENYITLLYFTCEVTYLLIFNICYSFKQWNY